MYRPRELRCEGVTGQRHALSGRNPRGQTASLRGSGAASTAATTLPVLIPQRDDRLAVLSASSAL
ncbi:hypothetical protein AMK18_30115 [Streptomyces sp. CB01249]|nr:hypothetical protein AMK18_30115 [Streptomyces sp. CB01249]